MKFTVLTLGCKVNQAESAFIEGSLRNLGFSSVPLSETPDYCVINTCTVTAKSDYQSRQLIRRAIRAGSKVIVTGCYSHLRAEEIKQIEGDVTIVDNNNKVQIISMLSNSSECTCLAFWRRARPYLKVQDGCNLACSYCIVPKARGRSRSADLSLIIDQALDLQSQGYNEIVLTGIHLGSYGRDMQPNLTLAYLVETILEKTIIPRIRLSSIELNELDEGLLDLLKDPRICKHVHIPLQSGDDSVLHRMNRKYDVRSYARVIENIADEVPDIGIGTDVIVGFPGETDNEFLNTKNLLKSLPVSYMHIFPFSPRPDTPAAMMQNQIPFSVKKERRALLNALNEAKKSAYMKSQMHKILDIIVEEERDDQSVTGTSSNYLKIKVPKTGYPKKSLVYVRPTGIENNLLSGFPIERP